MLTELNNIYIYKNQLTAYDMHLALQAKETWSVMWKCNAVSGKLTFWQVFDSADCLLRLRYLPACLSSSPKCQHAVMVSQFCQGLLLWKNCRFFPLFSSWMAQRSLRLFFSVMTQFIPLAEVTDKWHSVLNWRKKRAFSHYLFIWQTSSNHCSVSSGKEEKEKRGKNTIKIVTGAKCWTAKW